MEVGITEFARRVEGGARLAHVASVRRDVDDEAAVAFRVDFPEEPDRLGTGSLSLSATSENDHATHFLCDVDRSPEQHLDLLPRRLLRDALDLSQHRIAGTINDDVQAMKLLLDHRKRLRDLGCVCDIERQHDELVRGVLRLEVCERRSVARRGNDALIGCKDGAHERFADAARRSCDYWTSDFRNG